MANWNASMQFPTDSNYINRITEATFGLSKSSGNPMITLEMEVIAPEEVEIAGQKVNIAGTKTINYYTVKVLDKDGNVDTEKTANCYSRVFVSSNPDQKSLFELLGLDGSKENPENPNVKQLVGKTVFTLMASEVKEQRATPTAEQLAKAKVAKVKAEGSIMKDPVTGKSLIKYWPRVQEIFGLAPSGAAANKPY